MRTVYSVDWDWFTGSFFVCCDPLLCGFPGCNPDPKRHRGRGGEPDEPQDTKKRWQLFFRRTSFNPDAQLYVAENHGSIYRLLRPDDQLYDWDHHCDEDCPFYTGLKPVPVNCANWRHYAKYSRDVRIKNSHTPRGPVAPADLVFLCKSSPWTPQTLDPYFNYLITKLAKKCELHFVGLKGRELRRDWQASRGCRTRPPWPSARPRKRPPSSCTGEHVRAHVPAHSLAGLG